MDSTSTALETLYATGHWLVAQHRHRDALSVFRTMLLVEPRDERGWLALATCHEALDELDKAVALCRLASSACSGGAIRCIITRARLHRILGDHDEAVLAYGEAAELAITLEDADLGALVERERGAR